MDEQKKPLLEGVRVTIVDDSRAFVLGLKALLADAGALAETFTDAREAIAHFKVQLPDIVVSDLEMPQMHGLEFIKAIRSNPKMSEVPIMILTGKDQAETMIDAIAAGADAFTGKAAVRDTFLPQVYALIRIKKIYHEATKGRQLESVKALIGTYKHEFGNVIAIMDGKIRKLERTVPTLSTEETFQGLKTCIDRFTATLKKLDQLRSYQEQDYSGTSKILKIG